MAPMNLQALSERYLPMVFTLPAARYLAAGNPLRWTRSTKIGLGTLFILFYSHDTGNSLPILTIFKNALTITQTSEVCKKS
jgi:hypothetical protein